MAAAQEVSPEKIVHVDPTKLKTHPENERIYNDEPDNDLIRSIEESGVREALIVNSANQQVISGRRRHLAALRIGLKSVPVVYRTYKYEHEEWRDILDSNLYRKKTEGQILIEIDTKNKIESALAAIRQQQGRVNGGLATAEVTKNRDNKEKTPRTLDRQVGGKAPGVIVRKKGKTAAAQVGKGIGKSERSVQRALSVINKAKAEHGEDWQQAPLVQDIIAGKKTISKASSEIVKERKETELKEKAATIEVTLDIRHADDLSSVDDESVDHIVTDPPYGVATGFAADFANRADMSSFFEGWDTGELRLEEIDGWVSEWARVMKTGGAIAVFCADTYVSFIKQALAAHGFDNLLTVVWHKTNPEPSVRQTSFVSSCEFIVTGSKGPKRNAFHWQGQNEMHNYIQAPVCAGKERMGHPTQKPESVIRWLIERLTDPGDVVLDNFAGTGTVGKVCKDLKRIPILIEKEQDYIDMMRVRLGE